MSHVESIVKTALSPGGRNRLSGPGATPRQVSEAIETGARVPLRLRKSIPEVHISMSRLIFVRLLRTTPTPYRNLPGARDVILPQSPS